MKKSKKVDLKKDSMRIHRWFLIFIGVFLFADGILSIYFGNSCLEKCLNNNDFGNTIRVIRAVIGAYLIYLGVKR